MWHLAKQLLTSPSPYFANALGLDLAARNVCSPGHDPDAFELWVQWLYVGELSDECIDPSDSPAAVLVKASSLGKTLGCPAFQDHAMMQLIRAHRHYNLSPGTLKAVYKYFNAVPGSKLRQWVIDQFTFYVKQGDAGDSNGATWVAYVKDIKDFGPDFIKACMDAGAGLENARDPCEYGQNYLEVLKHEKNA